MRCSRCMTTGFAHWLVCNSPPVPVAFCMSALSLFLQHRTRFLWVLSQRARRLREATARCWLWTVMSTSRRGLDKIDEEIVGIGIHHRARRRSGGHARPDRLRTTECRRAGSTVMDQWVAFHHGHRRVIRRRRRRGHGVGDGNHYYFGEGEPLVGGGSRRAARFRNQGLVITELELEQAILRQWNPTPSPRRRETPRTRSASTWRAPTTD